MKKFFFFLLLCSIAISSYAIDIEEIDPDLDAYSNKKIKIIEEINEVEKIKKNLETYSNEKIEEKEKNLEKEFEVKKLDDGTLFIPMNQQDMNDLEEQKNDITFEKEQPENSTSIYSFTNTWGKTNLLATQIDASISLKANEESVEVNHNFYVNSYVLGYDLKAFSLDIPIKNEKESQSANSSIKIWGHTINSPSLKGKGCVNIENDDEKNNADNKYIFKKECGQMWWVGFIPVYCTVSIFLEARLTLGTYNEEKQGYTGLLFYNENKDIQIVSGITPNVKLIAKVDGSIADVIGGRAEVTILDITMPFRSYASFTIEDGIEKKLWITCTLKALQGNITLYAKLSEQKKYERELWNWSGITLLNKTLYDNVNY